MKKFVVDENWTIFADLTQISAIRAIEKTVDVMINDSFHYLVYDGNSHADAAEFAEKLAAEVDAAKESHFENLLKRNSEESAKYACKVINGNSADDEDPPFPKNGILKITPALSIPVKDIIALYVGGAYDDSVFAMTNCDEFQVAFFYGDGEKACEYIGKLAKYCSVKTITEKWLYADNDAVSRVYLDEGYNHDWAVKVTILDKNLTAECFDDAEDALEKLRELKKEFDLD